MPAKDRMTHELHRGTLWEKTSQVYIIHETCSQSEWSGSYCLVYLTLKKINLGAGTFSRKHILNHLQCMGLDDHHGPPCTVQVHGHSDLPPPHPRETLQDGRKWSLRTI